MSKGIRDLYSQVIRFAQARKWEEFHTPKNLAMAMAVEAAEVLELFQWLTPTESIRFSKKQKGQLSDELADVYIYLLKLASSYNIDLVVAALKKMRKNARKYPVGKARGNAKKYTELS